MKKSLLLFGLLLVASLLSDLKAQVIVNSNHLNQEKTRTVYFFITDLGDNSDVQTLNDYLESFNGKVISVSTDLITQMCTLEIKLFKNEDIAEIIGQVGFIGLLCESLPPAGYKYVYNPDGTWKLKAL